MPVYYRNETLFSEIYLEEITRQPEQAEVLASLKVLREYREYADTASLAVWTQSYIHEVLAALGFHAQSKRAGLTWLYPVGSVEQPISLCTVTLPQESLDETRMGRNWAEKTIRALREQELQWGLLTNGKLWRIYHLNEATPYETYLEIDLESILVDQAKEAYQIFHKFLKAGNFTAGEYGQCQFDRFKKESKDKIDYIEKELANALRQREEGGKGVLSDLCMGYVEEIRTSPRSSPAGEGEDLDDETMRRRVYHGAMLYMFRLLFLFYAEARGLLSDENHVLLAGVEADARTLHAGGKEGGSPYTLWERLSTIFVDIDQTYNGGLFSPQESEFTLFIEETRVADRYLAETLFNLTTYREKNGQERPISYRDMNVRHLGTLYEGLLEHKLFITQEDTEVRLAKGKIEFIPVSRGGKLVRGQTLPAGAVYFGNDPSERKSTGSFYTPEYIVDYIVRNTVGEKLKACKAEFLRQKKANLEALRHAVDEAERLALASLLEERALRFVREKILALSVLDPAMGSGHFLVNAANLIANFITEFLNELGIEGETPTGTAYWRRWVVENCIYGVDINPLAVELAKLSLWILSMAKDQPLSFMNHHLKCGNSLMGTRLDDIGNYPFSITNKEPRQLNLFQRDPTFRSAVEDALTKSRLISSRASTSLTDVEEKKAWLTQIEEDLRGYKAICNVHAGLFLNNHIEETEYTHLVETKDFARAFKIEKTNQYFHWELEFLEIFFGRGGFDVVVSNPPYFNVETLGKNSTISNWLKSNYSSTWMDKSDILFYFITQAIQLLHGRMGYIVSRAFLEADKAYKLRQFILQNCGIDIVIDFQDYRVFQAANISTAIIILRRESEKETRENNNSKVVKVFTKDEDGNELIGSIEDAFSKSDEYIRPEFARFNYSQASLTPHPWAFVLSDQNKLFTKIDGSHKSLNQICFVGEGMQTGANDVFEVNEITIREEKLEKTFLRKHAANSDVRRYLIEDSKSWLIWVEEVDNIDKCPKFISAYLNAKKGKLQARAAYKRGNCEWWKFTWPLHKELYKQPKIITSYRAKENRFAIDLNGEYIGLTDTTVIFKNPGDLHDLKYYLALLNSRLLTYRFRGIGKMTGSGMYEYFKNSIGRLPISQINFKDQSESMKHDEIVRLVEEMLSLQMQYRQAEAVEMDAYVTLQKRILMIDAQIDEMIYELYGLTEEEIALVDVKR